MPVTITTKTSIDYDVHGEGPTLVLINGLALLVFNTLIAGKVFRTFARIEGCSGAAQTEEPAQHSLLTHAVRIGQALQLII